MPIEIKTTLYTYDDVKEKCSLNDEQITDLLEEMYSKGEFCWDEECTLTSWQYNTIINVCELFKNWK